MTLAGNGDRERPLIVCLLPARNVEFELPDALESIGRCADAIVALDDGSTDGTGAILASHPLVRVLLTNPRRDSYLGWDDGANRNRLLRAAADLEPRWVLSIDADERLDPSDADALRRFVAEEALAGCAYGLQMFRMHEDEAFDPEYEWVFRLFAFRHGQEFRRRQLDLTPVPTTIPPRAWVGTSLRLKHYGDMGAAGRQARLAKYRQADPHGKHVRFHRNLAQRSPGPYPRWQSRPADLPVLDILASGPLRVSPVAVEADRRPKLVCLLPARNAAPYLPAWFESVARFADAVVALDDGSTDDTAAQLERHPLVEVLLRNPRRSAYGVWDDSENRNRLLEAAADLAPEWIISIDADELVAPEDGAALRRFVDESARPGMAYAFPLYRMIDDLEHFDKRECWVERLFAFEAGQRFPADRFHFCPIATSIPTTRWVRTNIRMQHLNALTEERRRARRAKYAEVDPRHEWEDDYSYTDAPPGELTEWRPRLADEPVVLQPYRDEWGLGSAAVDLSGPVLTVSILVDEESLDEMVGMIDVVERHECAHPVEVVIVAAGEEVAKDVARMRPGQAPLWVEEGASAGRVRNAAVGVARGDYILFLDAAAALAPGALDALVDAHDGGVTMVEGRARNHVPTEPGWTAYFLAGGRCSFTRDAVVQVGGFPEGSPGDVEAEIRDRLLRAGHRQAQTALLTWGFRVDLAGMGELLRSRFAAARALGRVRTGGRSRFSAMVRRDVEHVRRPPVAGQPDAGAARRRVRTQLVGGLLASWVGAAVGRVRLRSR